MKKCVDRKEIRQMKTSEFNSFIFAFKKLAKDGTLNRYIEDHVKYWDHVHFTERFLVWHRYFILQFEKDLQKAGSPYLPYWDWTLDYHRPWESVVLQKQYFGAPQNDSGIIIDGVYPKKNSGENLSRKYPRNGPTSEFVSLPVILKMMRNTKQFLTFSKDLEYGAHAIVHYVLSGDMNTKQSPIDPLFWLHHAFCDKLWDIYQNETSFDLKFETSLILPWNISIHDASKKDCTNYELLPTHRTGYDTQILLPPPLSTGGNITDQLIVFSKISQSDGSHLAFHWIPFFILFVKLFY